ncbi:MAG: RagB/SusD family nutrient uptake outer membrane protein [Prevotellaceae bacterium]|jgi:tetratricopeptide (TPR) repeat protein|nr:RagB/SusD family nutrient uptake outer membrane protein [Prevotellaceae bacterium]
MKKYNTIILTTLLALAIMFTSCSDFLDTNPTDRLPADQVETLSDAEKIVNGFYINMKWNNYYGTPLMLLGETRGDDLRPRRETGGYAQIYNYEFTPSNYSYGEIWSTAYNIIMNTNVFLNIWENIPATSVDEIAQKNDFKGQALTVRAFCHFDIAKVYGYPYQKDNGQSLGAVKGNRIFNLGEQVERSSVNETYEFAIEDLTQALTLLSTDRKHGNFDYWGAKGLLARIYLYKGDYDNAFKHADEILTNATNPYSLIPNAQYVDSWGQPNSSETMLELLTSAFSHIDDNGGVDSWYHVLWHGEGFSAGNLIPTDAWFAILDEDPDDIRHKLIEEKTEAGSDFRWLAKFRGNNGDGDFKINNPMIMRLSEIYLIAAEAALMKSSKDQTKADYYLNAVRQRANPNATTITATVDEVFKERRKEFIGEGHRYYDLGRLGLTINRSTPDNKLPADSEYKIVDPWNRGENQYQVILPMPQSQRTANPAALQNPGYPD